MALQPPSFFQAPSKSSQKQLRDDEKLLASRETLASQTLTCPGHFLPTTSNLPPGHGVHAAGQQAAVLTSDLLAVEAHLQSRMRLLEEEKRNLISRIVELEKQFIQEKKEKVAQIEALTTQHDQAVVQAQFEVKQLSSECGRLREEGEARTAQLENELRTREEQHSSELDSLSAKCRELEAHCEALTFELEGTRKSSSNEVNELREQLSTATVEQQRLKEELEGQLRTVSEELRLSCQRVSELEGYLGGEIPNLPREGDGRCLTWREERESLHSIIETLEQDLHKMQSEDKLLNIRLTSLMEILSIQETTIAKQGQAAVSSGTGAEGKDDESAAALRVLLTRWREKVFVMLVQQKLSQIHESRVRHEASRKEAELREEIQRVEREKELLSHSLADRNAELQLQISKTSSAEERLDERVQVTNQLQYQLQAQSDHISCMAGRAQTVSQSVNSCMASLNQAMTKTANYEHRLSLMTGRLNSVKATLNYERAVQQRQRNKMAACADCGVQTESGEREGSMAQDLTSLSRAELISEVHSLSRERSSLVQRLEESTATFEQQFESFNKSCSSKLATTEAQMTSVQRENCLLSEKLSQQKEESEALVEKEKELNLQVEELEKELREVKSTMETRVDMAVQEQQQVNQEEMAEMEKLLSVARREHGKAVVQLQQLQRQLGRDKERAMEAMSLNQTRLEQQLEACRKKLEASQVERTLLMTVLRQEGITAPVKQRASPRRRVSSDDSNVEEDEVERTSSRCEDSQLSPVRLSEHKQPQAAAEDAHSQDISEVLKDLQMLSSSLLEMEKLPPVHTLTEQQSNT